MQSCELQFLNSDISGVIQMNMHQIPNTRNIANIQETDFPTQLKRMQQHELNYWQRQKNYQWYSNSLTHPIYKSELSKTFSNESNNLFNISSSINCFSPSSESSDFRQIDSEISDNISTSKIYETVQQINFECSICGDKASGKHYGAYSCDGCKGFFRRSVRKNQVYRCRKNNNCVIDKNGRNQCRYCRYKKCHNVGMKIEAVQKERDKIKIKFDFTENSHIDINLLLGTKYMKPKLNENSFDMKKIATLQDILQSIANQLCDMVNWALELPHFTKLSKKDQRILLRYHAGENLILGLCLRSLNTKDILLLSNNHIIAENTVNSTVGKTICRIISEVIDVFRELKVDETEIAYLKVIDLFNPYAKDLTDVKLIKCLRLQILCSLEDYVLYNHQCGIRGRLSQLLVILSPLKDIARQMKEQIRAANLNDNSVNSLIRVLLMEDNSLFMSANDGSNEEHLTLHINSIQNEEQRF